MLVTFSPHSIFKSWEHCYYQYAEFSFKEASYFLLLDLIRVSTFTLSFVLYLSVFSLFFFLILLTWGLLFQGFRVVLLLPLIFLGGKCLSGGLCWFVLISVDFWFLCLCSSGRRSREGSYIFWDICTHTSTYSYNLKCSKEKYRLDLGSKEIEEDDIN